MQRPLWIQRNPEGGGFPVLRTQAARGASNTAENTAPALTRTETPFSHAPHQLPGGMPYWWLRFPGVFGRQQGSPGGGAMPFSILSILAILTSFWSVVTPPNIDQSPRALGGRPASVWQVLVILVTA